MCTLQGDNHSKRECFRMLLEKGEKGGGGAEMRGKREMLVTAS